MPDTRAASRAIDIALEMVLEARAEERERCAKICDDLARENRVTRKGEGASLCADRIRKSGDHG